MKIYLIELDDVRVSHFLENLDLSCDTFNVLFVLDFIFLKNFNCYLKMKIRRDWTHTFSPVRVWVASLTLPNVPLPSDLPELRYKRLRIFDEL